jgi:hypothetical protein
MRGETIDLHSQPKPIQQAIKMSYRFLQALFAIEDQYASRTMFRVRNNGAGRLANHLTKADFQLAFTLHKIVNAEGKLHYTNRHLIFKQLTELFEKPISKDQFYQAFEKFIFNRLISVTPDSQDTISLTMLSYLEPEGDLGRFILLPALVCSKAFSELPLTHQKMYIYACGQQGDQRGKVLQINFEHLYDMLHRQEPRLIRGILHDLTTMPVINQEPLFAIGRTESNVMGRPKAVYQVNAKTLPIYEAGASYRTPGAPTKKGISRLMRRLKGYLDAAGCVGLPWYTTNMLFDLAALLRGKSDAYITYVMQRVKQMGQQSFKMADRMLEQIKAEISSRAAGIRLAIADQVGILDYALGSLDQFVNAFAHMGRYQFKRLCQRVMPQLEHDYSRPAACSPRDYRKPSPETEELEQVMDLATFRQIALQRKRDPELFMQLVQDAYILWLQGKIADLNYWFAQQVDKLPPWQPVADPPPDFNLIHYINQFA